MQPASISRVEVFCAELPFRFAFAHALATRRSSVNLFVRATLDDGCLGYGEGVPREYVTGETISGALAALTNRLAPRLLGLRASTPDHVPELVLSAAEPHSGEQAAWCALELAILDAYGHHFGCSVSRWLGDQRADRVRYDAIVPFSGKRLVPLLGLAVRALGFRNAKLKVGHDIEADLEKLRLLRRTLGPRADLRVDANCAWTADQALAAMMRLRSVGISSVEQPLAARDLNGLKRLTRELPESVIADESLCSLQDARDLVEFQACDAFNIRVSKCGGLLNSMAIARIAQANGLACIVGAQVGESGILSAAGRHLAAALGRVRYVEGSAGRLLLKEDLTVEDVMPRYGGWAKPFSSPGLGVHIRPQLLERFGRLTACLDAESVPVAT